MFSRRSATVLTLIKCFTPTFSETELPPQEPQPRVRDGFMPKLYRSPMPPCEDGELMTMRQAFMTCSNRLIFSAWAGCTYREAVWPGPPASTRCSALSTASWAARCLSASDASSSSMRVIFFVVARLSSATCSDLASMAAFLSRAATMMPRWGSSSSSLLRRLISRSMRCSSNRPSISSRVASMEPHFRSLFSP